MPVRGGQQPRPITALAVDGVGPLEDRDSRPVGGAGVQGEWLEQGWIWVLIVVLVVIGVLMFPMARGHFRRIRMVLELMDSGTTVSRDDFARVLDSGNPILTAGTGTVALLFIVYLMVLKPF